MTRVRVRATKVGPKGQVVIAKPLRDKYGIAPGSRVEQLDAGQGVLIRPSRLLREWQSVAKRIGVRWPRDLDVVHALRAERER